MNSTNDDSLVVEASACLTTSSVSRRFAAAMTSAPTAPMAPPSVGVAMPRKIVPSTRNTSASGGISTMTTCCASRDIMLRLSALSRMATM